MRGITITVFVVVCIATALAYPSPTGNKKWGKKEITHQITGEAEESLYPSDKARPVSHKKQITDQGPVLYFREPRSRSFGGVGVHVTAGEYKPTGYWPRYHVFPKRARDDESEEEDTQDDDDDGSDEAEDDYNFDTPSWDYLFPKEETGPYAQRSTGVRRGSPQVRPVEAYPKPQDDGATYSLAPGSPGGPTYNERGRSAVRDVPAPAWGRNWGPWNYGVRQQRRGPTVIRIPKGPQWSYVEKPQWYTSEGPGPQSPQWNNWTPYYQGQGQYVRSPVRRNWNWAPKQWNDWEEEPQPQPWGVQPEGPRRIKNWSRPRPSWEQGPVQHWGYY